MNPRIQELYEQALDQAVPETWTTLDPAQLSKLKAKFAELIVKECISVPYAMWDQAELNADVAVKIEHRIREHFGVE